MPLINVQGPRAQRGPSALERVAMGVDIATKVLGTGIQAAKLATSSQNEDLSTFIKQLGIKKDLLDIEKLEAEKEARPAKLEKAKAEAEIKSLDLEKAQKIAEKGEPLKETTTNTLAEAATLPQRLNELEQKINKSEAKFGPIMGRVASVNEFDEEAQILQAEMKGVAQSVGRVIEGGVLRREDEIKYEKILPNLKNQFSVAKEKLNIVRNMLKKNLETKLKLLQATGKDVSEISGVLNRLGAADVSIDTDALKKITEIDELPKGLKATINLQGQKVDQNMIADDEFQNALKELQ